jgi:hypothetical protein
MIEAAAARRSVAPRRMNLQEIVESAKRLVTRDDSRGVQDLGGVERGKSLVDPGDASWVSNPASG